MNDAPDSPLLGNPESARSRLIAFAFWGLAVVVLVNAHWLYLWGAPLVRYGGYWAILACCLLLMGSVNARLWKKPGTPGLLIAATITSYLIIGVAASFVNAAPPQPDLGRDILRQVFFFIVLLAAALGGRALLERSGIEALLKGVLATLMASCIVILASPVLQDVGLTPLYRLPFRLTGAFTDVNDAGFVGCMTAAAAVALLCNGGRRKLAYSGLIVGYAAAWGSLSRTAVLVIGALSIFFLLSNGLGRRRPMLRWLCVLSLGGIVVHTGGYLQKINIYPDYARGGFCSTTPPNNPGLSSDCTILLAVRDTLAGDAVLNWDDAAPVALWQGVKMGNLLEGRRVVALDLSRMELSGRIPPELGALDQLVSLRLNRNRLSGSVPAELGNLANLTELRIEENQLTGVVPAELEALDNLTIPGLADNDLAGAGGDTARDIPPVTRDTVGSATGTAEGEETDSEGLMKKRPLLWKIGLEKIRESPIIGSGVGRFHYSMEGAPFSPHQGRHTGVHNVYLMLVGEAGIAPLSFYLLFLFSLMRLRWAAPESPARDVVVGWALVMALYGMAFHHYLTQGTFMFLAGLSCALAAAVFEDRKHPLRNPRSGLPATSN